MDHEKLIALAERFLNEQGQEDVEGLLDNGEVRRAKIYLLGSLDKALAGGEITDQELAAAYVELGLDPVEIADIRNRLPQY